MAELDLEQIALDCLARLEAEGDTALEDVCARHVAAGVNSRPTAGNGNFTLFASEVPPGAFGLLAIGLPAAAPIPFANVCVLVNPTFGTVFIPGTTQGLATFPVSIPVTPLPPYGIATQWGFFDPTTGLYSASSALVF